MNRIRELRWRRGWSLDRLSRESQVSKSHLSSIERGKKEPTISVARRVADALGEHLDEVFPAKPCAGAPAKRTPARNRGGLKRREAPGAPSGEVGGP